MPPKRQSKKNTASKLANELGLSAEEETEIHETWDIFVNKNASDEAGEDVIVTKDVKKAFGALGFVSPREEMQEIVETVDPNDLGYVLYDQFLNVAALKMRDRDTQEEVEKAFQLFTSGKEGPIKLEDLRRIADKLKEELTDDQLRDMLSEASDNPGRGVNMREFEGVMKRAGVL